MAVTFAPALPRPGFRHANDKLPRDIGKNLKGATMRQSAYPTKADELEHLLNDPDVPMEPARIWALLAELAGHKTPVGGVMHEYVNQISN
jgi:hypothetical protein